jgi:hypothetical protein
MLLVLAAFLGGCDSKTPKVATAETPGPAANLREDAALLAGRGDYAAAEAKYREALKAQPDDVELRFGLASVLSQLDRREEAIVEFRWVVSHGRLGRPEVDSARRWLAEADAGAPGAAVASTTADPAAQGGVAGKLTWPGIPAEKTFGVRIVLEGDGGRKTVKSKLNGTYTVEGLTEGQYKLTGLAGPVRLWNDLPVTVSAGRHTTFDLGPGNASVSPSEFPVRAEARP